MEMKNPHTIWATVAIVVVLVAGSVTLVILDKDVSIILTLATLVAVPVLGAFGAAMYQKMDQVKEASNGNVTRILEALRVTQEQLTNMALSVNPPSHVTSPDREATDPSGVTNPRG